MISQIPTGPVDVPPTIAALADGDVVTPVWLNQVGGITFRLGEDRYVKWVPTGTPELDLPAETARLEWARQWITVPRVLDHGTDESGSWLVTATVPGRSAVDPRWVAEPATAATAIGVGLRVLHEALPVQQCPFEWGVQSRLAGAPFDPPPPIDRLVVCHGDACAPNTLLHDDGTFAAHVDLDALGVADRWADLAVAAMSTEWNYGPGYDTAVYDGYGIAPDPERIAFYRDLWNAT